MDTKKIGLIGIIIAVLMIAGTVGYVYMGNDDGYSPFAPADDDDVIGSSMEQDEMSTELMEELETEKVVNEDNTVTLEVDGLGTFTLDPETEGIIVLKDDDTSIEKTVKIEGETVSFNGDQYYSEVKAVGTYIVTATPTDEDLYSSFSADVNVVSSASNDGKIDVCIIVLEETVTEGVEGVEGVEGFDESITEENTEENTVEETQVEDNTRTLVVRIVDENGNGVDDVNVKIGTSIYKKTDSNGYTSSAEISTLSSYYINAYGNDDYETKSILLTKGTSDITKTITVEQLSGIPSGWVELKVKAVSTVDYKYDGSDAILENVGMYFRTSSEGLYDVDRGAKVNYAYFMTDEQGYSPDNRFYVPKTGTEIEIDAQNHIIAYGIDRTLTTTTDKNQYVWQVNYCPKPVTLQFKSTYDTGTTSTGKEYGQWIVAYNDKQVGYNNYDIFHRANLFMGAVFNGLDGNAKLEYSTDGTNWHYLGSLKDPYTTYNEVTIDVPSSGTTNLYIKVNYDAIADTVTTYDDVRLWTIGMTSNGYIDIDYEGKQ